MWETWVRSLGQEDPLEKEMATQSSTLAWKIPWTEKPGRLQSMGSQRVRTERLHFLFPVCPVVRTPSFHCRGRQWLPGSGTKILACCSQRPKKNPKNNSAHKICGPVLVTDDDHVIQISAKLPNRDNLDRRLQNSVLRSLFW